MNMKIAGLLGAVALAATVTAADATAVQGTVGSQGRIEAGTTARVGGSDAAATPDRGVQVAETVIIRRGGYHRPYRPIFHRPMFHREHERGMERGMDRGMMRR